MSAEAGFGREVGRMDREGAKLAGVETPPGGGGGFQVPGGAYG